jgi:hypothetical protein
MNVSPYLASIVKHKLCFQMSGSVEARECFRKIREWIDGSSAALVSHDFRFIEIEFNGDEDSISKDCKAIIDLIIIARWQVVGPRCNRHSEHVRMERVNGAGRARWRCFNDESLYKNGTDKTKICSESIEDIDSKHMTFQDLQSRIQQGRKLVTGEIQSREIDESMRNLKQSLKSQLKDITDKLENLKALPTAADEMFRFLAGLNIQDYDIKTQKAFLMHMSAFKKALNQAGIGSTD